MTRLLCLLPVGLAGCLTLDSFVFNPIPCGAVGPSTCEDADNPWDAVCVACAEPYDWQRDYDWMPGTLAAGESVRPIPSAAITALSVSSDDGLATLDAYFIASHGENPAVARTTIVYDHGNYANIEHYQPRVRFLYEAGFNVLVWDYRGYGKTDPETTATPDQLLADARQVRALADTLAPDPDRIVAYGYSLGGIAAVEQSLAEPGCATLLEAPFTSLSTLARANSGASLGESFLSEGKYDNIAKIADYHGPLLVMLGDADREILPADIEALYAAAPGPKTLWELPGVRHGISDGGVPEAGFAAYVAKIESFFVDRAPGCLAP